MRKILALSILSISLLLLPPANSQVSGGVVTGRVVDASGANVPDVRVELENVDTGQRITITTDAQGVYIFNGVPAGRYRVITTGGPTAATTAPSREFTVEGGRTNTININLPSGPGTDAITEVEAVPVDRSPASIFDVWGSRYVHYLPKANYMSRDGRLFGAYNLAELSEATSASVPGWPGGPAFAGQRPGTNLYHINGVDNKNLLNGGPLVYLSNQATTEFTLLQNQHQPLFGHSGGPKFNSFMRAGTNKVHGQIYNYLQNRHLNALDRPLLLAGYTEDDRPRYDQNRLGGSIGFPIIPSKVFFYGNFEYIPLGFEAPFGGVITAPTAAGLNTLGQIGAVSNTNLGILRNALAGNVPQEATDFINVAGRSIPVGRVFNIQDQYQNQYNGAGALDFNISENDQLRMRYVHNEIDRSFSGGALAAFQAPSWQRSLLANVSHYHNFSDTVTNELRLGYNRIGNEQYLGDLANNPNLFIGNGLNLSVSPQYAATGIVNTYHVADNVSVRWRGHQLRFGFDGRRRLGFRDNLSTFAGDYAYSSLERFVIDLPPDVNATRAFGNERFDLGNWDFFGFVNDTWNVRPGFTLDLGARYQYSKIPRAFRNQGLNIDASVPGLVTFNDPEIDRWNFAPYVGVAVAPWQNRTVIRGSFGMWYDATYWQPFLLGFAPHVTRVATGNLTSNVPGFLQGGGLQDPAAGVTNGLTIPQARASVTSFIGDQEMPYSMQWNAAIQQAFWDDTTIEFKYLGNRGVHQPVYGRLNYSGVTANRSLPVFTEAPSQGQLNNLPLTLNDLRTQPSNAFTQAGFTNPINTISFDGNSWYHAGAVTLNHRFTGGFQMNANYTYSRWEADSTGTPLDLGAANRFRTWSPFDTRHQANITGLFEVAPLFDDAGSILRNVFADFNIAGSYNYQIGGQLTPITMTNSMLNFNGFGTPAIMNANAPANMTVSGLTALQNSAGRTVAYQVNNPNAQFISGAPGVFSGLNRGGIQLDDVHNIDLAVTKRFNFRESAAFEIRGEAYNLLNRGQVTAGSLHSLGYNMFMPQMFVPGTIDVNNLAALDALPVNARTVQLGLRFTF